MKNFFVLLLAIFGLLSCGNNAKPTTSNPPQRPTVSNNLSIFSYRYLIQDQQLMGTYQARANKVVDVYLKSGPEIVAMAQKGQLFGDLVILDDLYQAHLLKKAGVLQPFNAGTFGDYVPAEYIDNEGYWAGLTRWSMSFVYNRERADILQMRNYAGILDPRYKGRVAVAHPDSSGLVSMIAGMIAAHGEEPARIYLESLQKNLMGPPAGTDWGAISAVVTGQADVALVNGSQFLRYRNSGNPELFKSLSALDVEIPVDAKRDNYYNISPICMLANAPQRSYAIAMVEFLTVQDNQNFFSAAAMEYPVNVFSEVTEFLNDAYNVAQGNISAEMTENQLDTARELIRRVWGL